ncbi:MAG: exodeoxyribonuclease III [Acidobacteria bacterium]|nr:exodeoxyribonuclease III [Acidobacteriota bacterium]
MKIATWNVNGIRAREAQYAEWLAEEKPDIVCLQETKAPRSKVPESICDADGYHCYWHGSGGYSGTALHIRTSLSPEPGFYHPELDFEDRVVAARLGDLVVASIYLPNGGKDFDAKIRFLHQLDDWIETERADGLQLILCGDMNITRSDQDVHPKERKPNAIGQLPEERTLFNSMIDRHFVDLGRAMAPNDDGLFTWWAPWRNMRQRNIGWRLDYILATRPVAATASSCVVRSDVGQSDHAPVVAELEWSPRTSSGT